MEGDCHRDNKTKYREQESVECSALKGTSIETSHPLRLRKLHGRGGRNILWVRRWNRLLPNSVFWTQRSYCTHEFTAVWLSAQVPYKIKSVSFPTLMGRNPQGPTLAKSFWQLTTAEGERNIFLWGGGVSDICPSTRGWPYTHEPMGSSNWKLWVTKKKKKEIWGGWGGGEETMKLSGASRGSLEEVEGVSMIKHCIYV